MLKKHDVNFGAAAPKFTSCFLSIPIRAVLSVSGLNVTNESPFARVPEIVSPLIVACLIALFSTSVRNCE